jgi:hypothetical protein
MVVFCRDCGAATGFNSQGSVIGAGEHSPDEAGTIFITDKDEATVSWIEPDRVVVTFKGAGPDLKPEKQFQGLTIDYR